MSLDVSLRAVCWCLAVSSCVSLYAPSRPVELGSFLQKVPAIAGGAWSCIAPPDAWCCIAPPKRPVHGCSWYWALSRLPPGTVVGEWLVPELTLTVPSRKGTGAKDSHGRPCVGFVRSASPRGFLCGTVGFFRFLCRTVRDLSSPCVHPCVHLCVHLLDAPLERACKCTHVVVHISLGALLATCHVTCHVECGWTMRTHNKLTSALDAFIAGVCYEVVMSLSKKTHNE